MEFQWVFDCFPWICVSLLGGTGMMSLELSVASDPEMLLLKDSPLQNKSLYSFFF